MSIRPTRQYMNAIFFDANGKPYKYHNIKNTDDKIKKFEEFARKKRGLYINYYDSKSRAFIKQVKI